jgi:acylphosphatase
VRVHGYVQGVAFRQRTAERARSLGIGGFVMNCTDGTVEAAFEGPRELVESMVAWCRRGPAGADVRRVEQDSEEPRGEHRFRITFAQTPRG